MAKREEEKRGNIEPNIRFEKIAKVEGNQKIKN